MCDAKLSIKSAQMEKVGVISMQVRNRWWPCFWAVKSYSNICRAFQVCLMLSASCDEEMAKKEEEGNEWGFNGSIIWQDLCVEKVPFLYGADDNFHAFVSHAYQAALPVEIKRRKLFETTPAMAELFTYLDKWPWCRYSLSLSSLFHLRRFLSFYLALQTLRWRYKKITLPTAIRNDILRSVSTTLHISSSSLLLVIIEISAYTELNTHSLFDLII